MVAKEERPNVGGVTEADYQQWRHHPITKMFRAYLDDYHQDIVAGAATAWLSGNLELPTADELRGRALTVQEIADLPFSAILEFYRQQKAAEGGDEKGDEGKDAIEGND